MFVSICALHLFYNAAKRNDSRSAESSYKLKILCSIQPADLQEQLADLSGYETTMDHFSSKDMALSAQKKILSRMATKSSVQMFIDDTTSEILDELYRVSKGYSGNKSEAQKVIKDLVKIAVKIGLLFRNNRFNTEELGIATDFKKKLHQGAMTAISFYELVNTHLTPKSHNRINHVFNHYSDPELLTKLYDPSGIFRPNLTKICKGLDKLVEDGTI
ncbi:hypothetical protein F7725_017909 [Dissostichus mawsoni]|uniref:Tumor necrosis factor alpha-induced protein 8-like protein n=1 Tax=Dissostichus mawsoni TaxID=36200 RepID=A0A7J5XQ44_DISMA|nr:hypothetical protein F7725_017909 [Dissostichus mawsoni]